MKTIELRKKTQSELKKMLEEDKEKLGQLRLQVASRQLKDVSQIAKVRTNVARLLTLLSNADYIDSKSNNK